MIWMHTGRHVRKRHTKKKKKERIYSPLVAPLSPRQRQQSLHSLCWLTVSQVCVYVLLLQHPSLTIVHFQLFLPANEGIINVGLSHRSPFHRVHCITLFFKLPAPHVVWPRNWEPIDTAKTYGATDVRGGSKSRGDRCCEPIAQLQAESRPPATRKH